MGETLCICGTGPSRLLVNQEPLEYKRWGQNACRIFVEKLDVFFELHTRQWIYNQLKKPQKYVEFMHYLQHFKGPVYLIEADPTVPNSRRYPLEEMIETFGIPLLGKPQKCSDSSGRHDLVYAHPLPQTEAPIDAMALEMLRNGANAYVCARCGYAVAGYFSSSIAYMLALAISQKPECIKLFGIHMNSKMEYAHQRSGCEYYLGYCRAVGIDFWLPDSSPILKSFLYGRLEQSPMTIEKVEEKIRQLKAEEIKLETSLVQVRAKIKENEEWLDLLNGVSSPMPIPAGRAVMVGGDGR